MKRHGSMNRIYRLVWNHTLSIWVAVSEIGRGAGKTASGGRVSRRAARIALAGFLAAGPAAVLAAPTGGQVTAGSAQITQSGQTTTINQSSANVSINWQSFNVGAQQTVDFVQPSASSIAVNRIFSDAGTVILGHINANGQIFLIDPNGVLFGAGAQVDVGGLVASTLDLSSSLNSPSSLTFSQSGPAGAKVVNQGSLTAAQGGYVALMGQQVLNQGTISARLGSVALGGGSAASLTFNGNQLLHFQIDKNTLNSLAENQQLIEADGGQVIMTAGAKNSVLASVVNNSGVIEARTVDDHSGVITLLGGMTAGTVNVGGTLDASAANGGNGGQIETSGSLVKVSDSAKISTQATSGKTGSWLIDPTDFTIAASGGDITGSALSTELASTNVVIQSSSGASGTAGNVNVDAPVSWSSNSVLSLVAANNVNVNAPITATGASAGLVITPGSGGNFNLSEGASITLSGTATPTLSIAGVSYTVINKLGVAGDTSGTTLQGMLAGGNYALGSNIDATATDTWNGGAGFTSLPAVGIIEGLGHSITNLYQNSASASGLVRSVQGLLTIRDLGLVNVDIVGGGTDVGGLLGDGLNNGNMVPILTNDYVTGTISARYGVGGLVGAGDADITNSFSLVNVTGQIAGGLAGSYAGQAGSSTITNSYAGGSVTLNTFGQSAAGQQAIGGLVGRYGGPAAAAPTSYISNSYSDAAVKLGAGSTPGGGLIGESDGIATVTNSYWDMTASGQATSVLGTGLSGTAALQQSSYAGFNFSAPGATWVISSGFDHPLLGSYLKPLTITTSASTDVYNGSGQSGTLLYSDPAAVGSVHLQVVSSAVNVGTYNPSNTLTFVPDQFGWNPVLVNNGDLTITPKPITPSAAAGTTKVYDGTTTSSSPALSSAGVVGTDNVTFTDTSATYDTKNVGTGKTITVTGIALGGTQADDYALTTTSASTTGAITPLALTFSATGNNKTYDGTTTDTVTLTPTGVIAGDVVTLSDTSSTFANKNAGNGKSVTVSGITASGSGASNYTFATTATTTADITPLAITVSATGQNKVYNDNTGATVNLTDSGVIAGDVVNLSDTSATFSDKNVGNAKTITVSGISASGADAGNYTVNPGTTTTGNITPATVTIAATGTNKVYDGTTVDPVNLVATGVFAGDSVSATDGSATFANKNVGNGKTVSVTGITLSGANASDYVVASSGTATTTANITPLALVASAIGTNKVYDGTTADTVTFGSTGIVAGDVVNLSDTSATFSDKNVGNGKTVTVSGITATGADASNYTFAATSTTTANITPLAITVSATGQNKVYNDNTGATVNLTDSGVIAGDVVNLSDTSATFSDKNVGNAKTITVSGISASGADAGNYTVNPGTTTTGNITPATVTIAATGTNKVYDGTTTDLVSLIATGVFAGDSVSATDGSATFGDKNVGNGKTVTVTGITLAGPSASNYVVASAGNATTTANITPLVLTASATGTNRVYNGTTADVVTLADTGVIAGDSVTLSDTSSTFSNKNVGNGKTVTVSGITASGADAGNYAFAPTTTTTANITPLAITVSATGANKVYDATTAATATLADSGVLAGDVVNLSDTSSTFSDKNVGNSKTITVSGISASGADAGNYSFNASTTTTGNITPATVTIAATGTNKVYDGTTADQVSLVATGVIAGDSVSATDGSATFANKNVGNGKSVSVTGITLSGADASNYVVASSGTATTSANITPLALTASATGTNKVYDGTTADTVTLAAPGIIAGDVVSLGDASANFSDKNVGNGKTVTVLGVTAAGTDAGNYAFAATTTTTANITPLAITVSATGANKVYNDSTGATVNLTGSGVIAGDVVNLSDTSSTFSDKNVGNGKTITVLGISASGADAGNYTVNPGTTTTANITPATVTIAATGTNKVYDGTTTDPVSLVANGVFAGDSVSATDGSATFANKNVGNGKTVSVSGITLSGADASDYVVASSGTATTTANITPLAVTVSASGTNRVYNGLATDAVTLEANGIVTGDAVTLSDTSSTFSNPNVGSGKVVTVTGITASGADASNYSFATSTTTTANVTPATLTYVATPENVTVGKALPVLTGTLTGFVAGDTASNATTGTVTWETPATSSSGAGRYAIDGDGASAENYVFVQAPGNSTALTITGGTVTPPVPPVPPVTPVTPTGLPSVTSSDAADIRNVAATTTTPCTTVQTDVATVNANTNEMAASGCSAPSSASSLPSLRVINGGIRLPAELVSSR